MKGLHGLFTRAFTLAAPGSVIWSVSYGQLRCGRSFGHDEDAMKATRGGRLVRIAEKAAPALADESGAAYS